MWRTPLAVQTRANRTRAGAGAKAGREDLGVVGHDGVGHAVLGHSLFQCLAGRAGRGPQDQAGRNAKPAVVVQAGDRFQLRAVREVEAADHVHLPQSHGPGALEAAVIGPAALTFFAFYEAMAHQGPVYGTAPGTGAVPVRASS